jgi:hypothetical protein
MAQPITRTQNNVFRQPNFFHNKNTARIKTGIEATVCVNA